MCNVENPSHTNTPHSNNRQKQCFVYCRGVAWTPVPGGGRFDGKCLYASVILALLLPVADDPVRFRERVNEVVGTMEPRREKDLRRLMRRYKREPSSQKKEKLLANGEVFLDTVTRLLKRMPSPQPLRYATGADVQALSDLLRVALVLTWRRKDFPVDEKLVLKPKSSTTSIALPERVFLRYHPYGDLYGDLEEAMHLSPGIETETVPHRKMHVHVPQRECRCKEEILETFIAGGRRKRKGQEGTSSMK